MATALLQLKDHLRVVLIGPHGVGKSSVGNSLLEKKFKVNERPGKFSNEKDCKCEVGYLDGDKIAVIETPGYIYSQSGQTAAVEILSQVAKLSPDGLHSFILVMKDFKYTKTRVAIDTAVKVFGNDLFKYLIVVITRGDEYESDDSFKEAVDEARKSNKELDTMLTRCSNRFFCIESGKRCDLQKRCHQVQRIIEVVREVFTQNGKPFTSSIFVSETEANKEDLGFDDIGCIPEDHLSFVMVGKTGCGKSTLGNALLQHKAFGSSGGMQSETVNCTAKTGVFDGQKIGIIDTPGTMDTKDKEAAEDRLTEAIGLSPSGVHAFLLVVECGRFTDESREAIDSIGMVFGEELYKYVIVVFTRGDNFKTEEEFRQQIAKDRRDVKALDAILKSSNENFYRIDNGNRCDRDEQRQQLNAIIQAARELESKNEGRYTNLLFKKALEERQRRKQQKKEKEEMETKVKNGELEIEVYKSKIQRMRQENQRELENMRREIQKERERNSRWFGGLRDFLGLN